MLTIRLDSIIQPSGAYPYRRTVYLDIDSITEIRELDQAIYKRGGKEVVDVICGQLHTYFYKQELEDFIAWETTPAVNDVRIRDLAVVIDTDLILVDSTSESYWEPTMHLEYRREIEMGVILTSLYQMWFDRATLKKEWRKVEVKV